MVDTHTESQSYGRDDVTLFKLFVSDIIDIGTTKFHRFRHFALAYLQTHFLSCRHVSYDAVNHCLAKLTNHKIVLYCSCFVYN
jgi:hypothetical protein